MPSSLDLIPLASGEKRFTNNWVKACREGHRREQAYIAALRARGIKAAHPDDGWVKRAENKLHFSYPHYNDGAQTGDLVALGYEFDKNTRIVLLTGFEDALLSEMRWWKFEVVEIIPNTDLIP